MRRTAIAILVLAAGCFHPSVPVDPGETPLVKPLVEEAFDPVSCSRALAQQARLAGKSSSVKSSEVIQGVLRTLPKTGAPHDYCDRVLRAAPGISARPPRHLTAEEILAIGAVK